jgi:long-chain acyl-CoA synthetase
MVATLYQRWLAVLEARPAQTAVSCPATSQKWTFQELHALAQQQAVEKIYFPAGRSIEFFAKVLAGWMHAALVCPLDGQQPADLPDPAFLQKNRLIHAKLTSGSTGQPSLVLFTADQLLADVTSIVAGMGLRADSPNVAAISLAHSYGFSNIVLPLLCYGIPVVLVRDPFPAAVAQALAETPNATVAAVPALWRAWHQAGILNAYIRLAISAGAGLPLALEQSIYAECGLKLHNFYGSSECGGIAYDAAPLPRQEDNALGNALPNVEISSLADGRICIHGPSVAHSYWPATEGPLAEGKFTIPDVIEISPTGQLHMLGRLGDVMNLAGRKLHPSVLEQVLSQVPGVAECVVFSIPSPDLARQEETVAVLNLQANFSLPAIQRQATAALSAWQVPRHWWVTDTLRPNDRGKISRAAWRSAYLAARPQS